MSLETKPFPQRDLNSGEIESLHELTGKPQPIRQDVIRFLCAAQDMMSISSHVQYHLQTSINKIVSGVNYADKSSQRLYLSGALFYVAVAQIFGDITMNDSGIRYVAQKEADELMTVAPERLKAEAAGFTEVLERIIPVLDCGSIPRELVLVGAGATHMAVTRSIDSIDRGPVTSPTILPELVAYENDPDLARLSDRMKDLGRHF